MKEFLLLSISMFSNLFPFLLPSKETFIFLEEISNPQEVFWKNENEIVIVSNQDILLYSIPSGSISRIGERKGNDFVGLDSNGEIVFCSIEHFVIQSTMEFSTKFVIDGKEFKYFETIRPLHMTERSMIAITALDFLEQHFYEIDLEKGEMKEIPRPKRNIWELKIPSNIHFSKAYVENESNYIVEDVFGSLYIYQNRETTKAIIPTLIQNFKTILTKIPIVDPIPAFKLWFKSL